MTLDSQSQEFINAAKRIYTERLKSQLETEHFGELIALEPESGDFVLARTFLEMNSAVQRRFGTKRTFIFRIGGGGAVKIGGVGSHAR